MKRLSSVAAACVVLGCLSIAIIVSQSTAATPKGSGPDFESFAGTPEDAPLIVHEWGTFTSFSGSDGVKLEFRPLVDNDLPAFVNTLRPSWSRVLSKKSIRAIQRMETPVTYFYTPVERDVSVQVEFPQGLLTEFFPPVVERRPADTFFAAGPQDVPVQKIEGQEPTKVPLKDGLLDWGKFHLIPTESLRAHVQDEELSRRIGRQVEQLMFEPANGFRHYDAARETDSAIVQVRQGTAPGFTDYFEKFLFYRGIGNFDLPLSVTDAGDGTFELTNAGEDEVRSVFLVTVKGEQVWFRQYDAAAPQSTMSLEQSQTATDVDGLATAMATALIDEGLYKKEAWAMVNCWRSSWFGEEGTRLLYMVPTKTTDTLLPITISPQPDEIVRILVGRMEIMPISEEQRVLELVETSAQARPEKGNAAQQFRSPALDDLLAMGRLAEPALVRVQHIADDQKVSAEAKLLIDELKPATR